jgi:hypothetical protein
MKALVGIAVVLGLAGTILGVMAMGDEDEGVDSGEETTLELTGSDEERVDFDLAHIKGSHPLGSGGWSSHSTISGDATGEYVRTCVPVPIDDIECNGGFQLEDGDIETEVTEEAVDDGTSTAAIIGGTGDYAGAGGEMDVDFENDEYTLHLLLDD